MDSITQLFTKIIPVVYIFNISVDPTREVHFFVVYTLKVLLFDQMTSIIFKKPKKKLIHHTRALYRKSNKKKLQRVYLPEKSLIIKESHTRTTRATHNIPPKVSIHKTRGECPSPPFSPSHSAT